MLQVTEKDVAKCGYTQVIVILVQRYKGVCQQMPFFIWIVNVWLHNI